MTADPMPHSQQRVGSFVLLEKLGEGGLGEVWKARDHRLNRVVALKFILSGGKSSSHELAREAQAASALNHPNIVTILEIGETGGRTYIAMEFVEGETLRSRLGQSRVPFEAALDIITQLARALAAAHRNGIVHRDVKPENVMIRMDGYVKLVDFGLAKLLPWTDGPTNQSSSDATETGQIVGTVSYMSPEQARGKPVDAASDVFSLGIVLYEMLTGEHPFRADNPVDTLQRIIGVEPAGTRVKCPNLRTELHEVVDRCLKKDKTERFGSAIDLEADLRRIQVTPAESAAKSSGKWLPILSIVLLATVIGILVAVWNPFDISAPAALRSIAVMNFRTTPADAKANSFAIALSEDLGDALASQGFAVASRSAAMSIAAGGNQEVDTFLEGSVTTTDEGFRVHVELVSPETRLQLWSATINSAGADVFASEPAAAEEIATKLKEAAVRGEWNAQVR